MNVRSRLRAALVGASLAAVAVLVAPPMLVGAHAQTSDATPLFPPTVFSQVHGDVVYASICQGCHMPAGQGAVGAGEYPALADNPKLGAGPYVAMMVLDGHGAMPGFADMLNDQQVAEVVNYVRTHFGNAYPDRIGEADVKALRH
jgi:mono/diheme cytochrome c family protein